MTGMPERFEILTAGFYLFIQAKRRPLAFAAMMFWSMVLTAALIGLWAAIFIPLGASENAAGELTTEIDPWLVPALLTIFVTIALYFLLIYTGWNRFLVEARLPALIPFRLGADEGRTVVVAIVHWVLAMGAYLVLMIPILIVMAVVIAASTAAGAGEPGELSAAQSALLLLIYPVILVGGMLLAVKMFPAYAMTILEKRIVIFDSWAATKGVLWSAFVSTLIPLVFTVIFQIVAVVVQVSITRMSAPAGYDNEAIALSDYADPALLVPLVIAVLISGVLWVIMIAMSLGPYAYMAVWHDRNRQYREPQMAPLTPLTPSDSP